MFGIFPDALMPGRRGGADAKEPAAKDWAIWEEVCCGRKAAAVGGST